MTQMTQMLYFSVQTAAIDFSRIASPYLIRVICVICG